MPYIVMSMVVNVPNPTFKEAGSLGPDEFEDTTLRFAIFSAASGIEEIDDIKAMFNQTFDWCMLHIDSSYPISFQKTNEILMDEEVGYWHYVLEYDVKWEMLIW